MRGLVFHEPHRLSIDDVPLRALGPGELRVRVHYAGICGTDLRIYEGTKRIDGPRIIGHEFAGMIDGVGDNVSDWSVSQRVTVYPIVVCGTCYACRVGRKNICVNRRTIGYEIDGGFADYVIIPREAVVGGNVIRVPDGVSDAEAATSEPVAAALQGVRRGAVAAGQVVLIIGAGPIGLAHVQLSHIAGAGRVLVSEPQAVRRAMALELGADDVLDPMSGALGDQLRNLVGDVGPDVAFVDVGQPEVVEVALACLRKGGRCVLFAGMPLESRIAIDPNMIHYREVDLVGSSGSTPELLAQVVTWAAEGKLNLRSLVSDILPLTEWEKGISMKDSAAGLKVLLDLS